MNAPAAIGHNAPPPLAACSIHIEDLFALASGTLAAGPITNDQQEAALDGLLDDLRLARKAADEQRVIEKRPHDDAAKAVQEAWKPLLERCDAGTAAVKAALTPYRTAKQRAKDEAGRIAREEAAAVQKAAQDALRGSDDLDARFAAEEQLKRAGKLAAQANRIDRAPTGLRTTWEAEVTDHRTAMNAYLKSNPEPFKELVQTLADQDARGTRAPVPGVTFKEIRKAA